MAWCNLWEERQRGEICRHLWHSPPPCFYIYKEIHKLSWTSPDGSYQNQIDHVAIISMFKRSLQDVRTFRGANVGSDHQLVIAKIELRLHKTGKQETKASKLRIPALANICHRGEKQIQYSTKCRYTRRNRGKVGQDQESVHRVGLRSSGAQNRKKNKEWISGECWTRIEERRKIKCKLEGVRSERVKGIQTGGQGRENEDDKW